MEGSIETRPGFIRSTRRSAEDIAEFHKENEAKYGIESKICRAIDNGRKLMIKNPTTGEVERCRPKNLVISVWQKPEAPEGDGQIKRRLSEEPLVL